MTIDQLAHCERDANHALDTLEPCSPYLPRSRPGIGSLTELHTVRACLDTLAAAGEAGGCRSLLARIVTTPAPCFGPHWLAIQAQAKTLLEGAPIPTGRVA